MNSEFIIGQVRHWLESIVIGLNLCPFAGRELAQGRVRFLVSEADRPEQLLELLYEEIQFLQSNLAIETTLLIHPAVLQEFREFNQFLDRVDTLLEKLQLQGEFQVASFHPDYQFAGTHGDEPGNYTNRAPYPILHILREVSVERAINSYPNVQAIPDRNIELMREMGIEKLREMLRAK